MRQRSDDAVSTQQRCSETLDGEPAWLGWRVEGPTPLDMWIRPVFVRGYKRGRPGVITKLIHGLNIKQAIEEVSDPRDRQLLALWELFSPDSADPWDWLNLIAKFSGHPRVYFHDTSSRPLEIISVKATLQATQAARGELEIMIAFGDELHSPAGLLATVRGL